MKLRGRLRGAAAIYCWLLLGLFWTACGPSLGAAPQDERERIRAQRALGGERDPAIKFAPPPGGRDRWGLKPLTELDGAYKGETGGLYGEGRSEPPAELARLALEEMARIVPRDRGGDPSRDGKLALISIGMSNTHAEFMAFMDLAAGRQDLNPSLVIVDGAQGANDASHWADPQRINPRTGRGLWERVDEKLSAAGVTRNQVQVAWINLVLAFPERLGEFPEHARRLEASIAATLHLLKRNYPNVALAFLSSRIYAGYSDTDLSPEPYAYEAAFSMRWLIERQQRGDPELNWSPERGGVRAPLLLWGPYMWADGMTPRESDQLVWLRNEFNRDGVHPNEAGLRKAGRLLLDFFSTDPFARPWFLRPSPSD